MTLDFHSQKRIPASDASTLSTELNSASVVTFLDLMSDEQAVVRSRQADNVFHPGIPALELAGDGDSHSDQFLVSLPLGFKRESEAEKTAKTFAMHFTRAASDAVYELFEPTRQLEHPETEAAFTRWTEKALLRDADKFPPVKNPDGSTTYTLLQVGLTDRAVPPNNSDEVKAYLRKVEITVPAGASNLRNCQLRFSNRELIDESSYKAHLMRAKERQLQLTGSSQMTLYTHGILTSANGSDTQSLALEVTHGHPVINVDWRARPMPSDFENAGLMTKRELYKDDQRTAAASGAKFGRLLDSTIETLDPKHTTLIAFSHGSMFDARYLQHRVESNMPRLHSVVLTHPDIPEKANELVVWSGFVPRGLLSASAERSFVVGNGNDQALSAASYTGGGNRLGNDSKYSRGYVGWNGGVSISDASRRDRNDLQHFINYTGIAELVNAGPLVSTTELQKRYDSATQSARWRWYKTSVTRPQVLR